MIFIILMLLLLPQLSGAEVTFIHLGDPQIGYRCNDGIGLDNTLPDYKKMTEAQCQERQAGQLDAILTYADKLNVDFVWVMGDLTEFGSYADEQALARNTFAAHPNLTYHWTVGNHDVLTNNCTELDRYLIDALNDDPDIRRTHWETWIVNNVHFMSVNASLWNFDAPACYALSACSDIAGGSSGSCSSNGDATGEGDNCNSNEACQDYRGYADDQMTVLGTFTDDFETARQAGTANAIFFGSHTVSWRWQANPTVVPDHPDDFNALHDMRKCTGDSTPQVCGNDYCNDAGLACDCADCDDGGTVSDVVGENWRSQIEDHLDDIGGSTTIYWLGGHNHVDANYSGTTSQSVIFDNYTSIGTGGPASGQESAPMGARLFHVDDSGTVTWRYIRANGHRVSLK